MSRGTLAFGCIVMLIFVTAITSPVFSQPFLDVSIRTEKLNYYYRQLVGIYGNVTLNGQLVDEGLVTVQLKDPDGQTIALRTVPANVTPSSGGTLKIASIYSCDMSGTPKTSFRKNTVAYFNVTVSNNSPSLQTFLLSLNPHDIDSTPFFLLTLDVTVPLPPGYDASYLLPIPIQDDWISPGVAIAYTNVLSDLPENGGVAFSAEASTSFNITTTGGQGATTGDNSPDVQSESYRSYQINIRLPPETATGFLQAYVCASSQGSKATNVRAFVRPFQELGDILFNRKIDIYDIVEMAASYAETPGSPDWNPEADLNADAAVDIYDIVIASGKYGMEY